MDAFLLWNKQHILKLFRHEFMTSRWKMNVCLSLNKQETFCCFFLNCIDGLICIFSVNKLICFVPLTCNSTKVGYDDVLKNMCHS